MFKSESDKLKVPENIYSKYLAIIKLLDNLIHDPDNYNNTNNLENIPKEYIDNLYIIAIEMYEFKQAGGDLRFAYDREILIQRFFEKIITDTGTSELEEYVRNSLKKLDNQSYPYVRVIKPYQVLEEEYQQFMASNHNMVQTTSISALESEKTLTQQFSFVRRKQSLIKAETLNCSLL